MGSYSVLEICAGAGGQYIGLERAGFEHVAAIDIDADACATLQTNRPGLHVIQCDISRIDGSSFRGVDLLAGGVPCPPFSIAGKQLGALDERDLFPEALRLTREIRPRALMIENVRGLASDRFTEYRHRLFQELEALGYEASWRLLNARDFGVPQLRPRFVLVALTPSLAAKFTWPKPRPERRTVGEAVMHLMASRGWAGATAWARHASTVAPTIVGGSKKHGGPDLGPTRAREQWKALGIDGRGIANEPPPADFPTDELPRLTIPMVAQIQGFPANWVFRGRKTTAYRQVGNAFPPPVAEAVARAIAAAMDGSAVQHGGQLRLTLTGAD